MTGLATMKRSITKPVAADSKRSHDKLSWLLSSLAHYKLHIWSTHNAPQAPGPHKQTKSKPKSVILATIVHYGYVDTETHPANTKETPPREAQGGPHSCGESPATGFDRAI